MNNLSEIIEMLSLQGGDIDELYSKALSVKKENRGDGVFLRGLIEITNRCAKNCYYCGIRYDNQIERYSMTDRQIIESAEYAYRNNFGSIAIQGGELSTEKHVKRVEKLICQIKSLTDNKLGITLSLGEQSEEAYKRWFEAGAHRYLLRIESSDRECYEKLHPAKQCFEDRVIALENLRKTGYLVGSGVMIGMPGQTVVHRSKDIMFFIDNQIDMCGMGPYVECRGTPLGDYVIANPNILPTSNERVEMTLKMIAVLRIMMPKINIVASTALQTLDPEGREKALQCGANVVMPNISPKNHRAKYALYDAKPLDNDLMLSHPNVVLNEWGDPNTRKNRDFK